MAYTTANRVASVAPDPPDATLQIVTDDVQQAQGAPQGRIDRVLRTAERIVKNLAPPDAEPRSEDYRQAAADTEISIFEYIWETRGIVSSQSSIVGTSVSYQSDPQVLKILRDAMGDYYTGGEGADSGKAYVGRLRSRRR